MNIDKKIELLESLLFFIMIMNIEKQIELLESLLFYIKFHNHNTFEYHINDDDYINYLEKIKLYKRNDGEYVIYYDESIINQIKFDIRELKLQKIIDMI